MGDSTPNDQRMVELQQLQREYRHMEINRRAYAEESQSILRTQQSTIDKLRKDNDALKNDISIIMRGTNRSLTTEQQETMQVLNEQGEKYLQNIEFEKNNIDTMTEQIQILRQKALNQRKAMGGVNASRENYLMIQKQIRILENRLDKSLIKFNEAINHNKTLRNQIDDLRRERIVFENIYRKMEKDLADKKKAMAEIIETSNQAYEQRDSYQMEIAAIEQANRREGEEFDDQMITLGRLLDQELQLPMPGASTASLGARSKSLTRVGTASSTFSPTRTAATTLPETNPAATTPMPTEIDFRERAQNFEEAFQKIKSATGITDIDELVSTFITNEEHNFSLFNYVNEQNNEIEKLEETIATLKQEEAQYATASGQDVSQHKEILQDLEAKVRTTDALAEKYDLRCQDLSRIIESLKRGLQSILNKLDWQEDELLVATTSNNANNANGPGGLLSPKPSSSKLLTPAATSPGGPDVLDVTNITESQEQQGMENSGTEENAAKLTTNGGNATGNVPLISEVTMVNYLGILEKKAMQLLHHYTNLHTLLHQPANTTTTPGINNSSSRPAITLDLLHGAPHDTERPLTASSSLSLVSVLGTGPKIPMGQDHLHVHPPKSDDYRSDEDEDDDDDDTRPLTRDELKSRTLNRLQKRIASLTVSANNVTALAASAGATANTENSEVSGAPTPGITKRSLLKK